MAFGILLLSAFPLLLATSIAILATPGMFKKTFLIFLEVVIWCLPWGLTLIIAGLGAPLKVIVLNVVVMMLTVITYSLLAEEPGARTAGERMREEKRCFDPDHPDCSTPSKTAGQNLRKAFLGQDLSKQAETAAPPAPSKKSILQEQGSAGKDGQSDTSDDASTIFTPPPSENEDATTSIIDELEAAREEKKDLEAAEIDEEYKRQMARLNMEEAEHLYNNTAKWSDKRETHFLALEAYRRGCYVLKYLKEHKMFRMKKLDLEIEYLENKSKRELEEDRNESGEVTEEGKKRVGGRELVSIQD